MECRLVDQSLHSLTKARNNHPVLFPLKIARARLQNCNSPPTEPGILSYIVSCKYYLVDVGDPEAGRCAHTIIGTKVLTVQFRNPSVCCSI